MRELTVISGKGGTGKTSVLASFAALADGCVLVDCDVDAPNLGLVLEPDVLRSGDFVGGSVARIDQELCSNCGRCLDICAFGAIELQDGATKSRFPTVRESACEGCATCWTLCPENAISSVPAVCGQWYVSNTSFSSLVHARLLPGADNSGKLVSHLRREARNVAEDQSRDLLLCDGPPGIGCAVIATLSQATLALIVIEPTVSGMHDFQRVVQLADHFKVRCLMCVNRYDINADMTQQLEKRAYDMGVTPVGRIPYDKAVIDSQLAVRPVVQYDNGPAATSIREIWSCVQDELDGS